MRILCLGDIAGPAACDKVCKNLWRMRKELSVDFVIVNGENCAVGNGIDKESAERIFICGADVITTGNHIWKKKNIRTYLDDCSDILRPANYTALENGFGYTIKDCEGTRILVMNVAGLVFLDDKSAPVFSTVDHILDVCKDKYDISVLDFHAEATSEKYAVGRHYDGRINIIFGTHTHVQTADEQILPRGTAYITDLGMCGSAQSILGIKSDIIISRYLGKEGEKFVFEDKDIELCGALFDIDIKTKKILNIERLKLKEN